MSLLSKAEVQFLLGQKQVSKSYEYKLKSIIKRKISTLLEKELPSLSHLFPNLDITKTGKEEGLSNHLLLYGIYYDRSRMLVKGAIID